MIPTKNEPMADVRDMYLAHLMLRREFTLLPALIRGVRAGDTRRAEVISAHAELLCRILHTHHEGEDVVLWPRLAERAGAEATAIVPTMGAQHSVIEQANNRAATLLSSWRSSAQGGDSLAELFEHLLGVLTQHTALEEEKILPLAKKYLTATERNELGSHGMKQFPKRYLPLTFGMMMYEGEPAAIKMILAAARLPPRLLMPIVAPRVFAAHARRVHGTASPRRVTHSQISARRAQ